jgi:hypothetical protein
MGLGRFVERKGAILIILALNFIEVYEKPWPCIFALHLFYDKQTEAGEILIETKAGNIETRFTSGRDILKSPVETGIV